MYESRHSVADLISKKAPFFKGAVSVSWTVFIIAGGNLPYHGFAVCFLTQRESMIYIYLSDEMELAYFIG